LAQVPVSSPINNVNVIYYEENQEYQQEHGLSGQKAQDEQDEQDPSSNKKDDSLFTVPLDLERLPFVELRLIDGGEIGRSKVPDFNIHIQPPSAEATYHRFHSGVKENVRVELVPEEDKKPSLLQELLPILLNALPQVMGGKMPRLATPSSAGSAAGAAPAAVPANATLADVKALFGEKKYHEALQMVEALLAKDPGNADLHAWKGHAMGNLAQGGNPLDMMKYGMGAMQEYEAALQLDPKNTDAHFGRGMVRLMAPQGFGGDLDGAIQDFEAALASPTPEAHFFLGEAYKKKGLPDKAKQAYQKALALNPNYSEAKKALEELR
jgi:tetratricopeptide (TPR) repeat protein